jgi:hypothetical protein
MISLQLLHSIKKKRTIGANNKTFVTLKHSLDQIQTSLFSNFDFDNLRFIKLMD